MNARIPVPAPEDLTASRSGLIRLALVCVIAESARVGASPLIRGLDEIEFRRLLAVQLPGVRVDNGDPQGDEAVFDEFEELLDLLMAHAADATREIGWVACAIATAAQRDNHLWQDMGLPGRGELSALLRACFPTLAGKNVKDMKWKKFFYRELCQRAGVPICKSPNCADCCDHVLCFGPEQ